MMRACLVLIFTGDIFKLFIIFMVLIIMQDNFTLIDHVLYKCSKMTSFFYKEDL